LPPLPSSFPALCKPNFGDASIGITKDAVVHNPGELVAYLKKLRDEFPGRPVLIQEYLTGPEYSVTVVGNPGRVVKKKHPLKEGEVNLDQVNLPDPVQERMEALIARLSHLETCLREHAKTLGCDDCMNKNSPECPTEAGRCREETDDTLPK